MSRVDPANFRVLARDDHGEPARCSYCARSAEHVVVLPLTQRPELDARIAESDGEELWVGLRAYCVLAMAEALAAEQKKRTA